MKHRPPSRLPRILGVALGLACLAAPHAWAAPDSSSQAPPSNSTQNPPPSSSPTALQRITVTGSAIPRSSVVIASPVEIITAKQIKEQGFTTISQVLRHLSANNSGTIPNSFTAGFAAGASGVALRALKVSGTLVLIDGHRAAPYALDDDGVRSFVDLNSIPLNAVKQIQVLSDSASSLYGSSAIAGVINIILYPTYRGTRITAEGGWAEHGGGELTRIDVISGTGSLSRQGYNAYLDLEYQNNQAIFNDERPFPFDTGNLSSIGGLNNQGGNPALDSGSIYGSVAPATVSNGNILDGTQVPGTLYQPLRPCGPGTTQVTTPEIGTYCQENFVSQFGVIQPQQTRLALDGRVTLKLRGTNRVYLNALYSQVRTTFTGAPAQIQNSVPLNTTTIALPPKLANGQTNPNDPFASQGEYALINYAFGDIPSYTTYVNHNLRIGIDAKGQLSHNWEYHVFGVINHTWLMEDLGGFINNNQLLSDVETGAYSFVNPASNSPQVLQALAPLDQVQGTTDMDELGAQVDGFPSVLRLPGGRAGVALGVQWRYDAQDTPSFNPTNNYQGLGNAHYIGFHNAAAYYGQLNLPLLRSRTWGRLNVDLSGREDDFSDFGHAFTHKFGIIYRPIRQVALRGTYATAFRAPSFAENGSSSSSGFITYTLPASYVAAHNNDGYVQPYGLELNAIGNPNVQPERARSYSYGIVVSPTHNISLSVDYYNILVQGVISEEDPTIALNDYFAGIPLPPGYTVTPDTPDPNFPTLLPKPVAVSAPFVNQNEVRTGGIDFGFHYFHDFDFGLGLSSVIHVTRLTSWEESLGEGGPLINMVGTQGPYILSSGAGTPRTRGNWATTFSYGPASVTVDVYYVSGLYMSTPDVTGNNTCQSTATPTGADLPASCRMPSFTYINLNARYRLDSYLRGLTVFGGIDNLTDRLPPFDPLDYAAVNYNPTYDEAGIIGRFFKLGFSYRF
jgi:iron complex outermembrane receptor protein